MKSPHQLQNPTKFSTLFSKLHIHKITINTLNCIQLHITFSITHSLSNPHGNVNIVK